MLRNLIIISTDMLQQTMLLMMNEENMFHIYSYSNQGIELLDLKWITQGKKDVPEGKCTPYHVASNFIIVIISTSSFVPGGL